MYEEKSSQSPFIRCTWKVHVDADGSFYSTANENWGIGFGLLASRKRTIEIIGPSIQSQELIASAGDEYWGIEFYSFVTMSQLEKRQLIDKMMPISSAQDTISISGKSYSIPSYEGLESFAAQLVADNLIHINIDFLRALKFGHNKLQERNRQRQYREVTGLSKKQIEQIKKAHLAYELIMEGEKLSEVAARLRYSDQAHMTRSLKKLTGKTPGQLS